MSRQCVRARRPVDITNICSGAKCLYSFPLSFKVTEYLLYARPCLSQWRENGEQADVLIFKQPHSWVLCRMLIQNKYTSSYLELVRALGNQIPVDAKSHDWVDVNCSPCENQLVQRGSVIDGEILGSHGATRPVYIPSSCLNLGTWSKGARLLTLNSPRAPGAGWWRSPGRNALVNIQF